MKTGLVGLATLAMTFVVSAATAQQTASNVVSTSTDWAVYEEASPRECFAVSAPKESNNTRDGQPVQVQRGDTLLFVFFRPGEGVAGQVTFTGGYPFAANSTVTLAIGGTNYTLFTEGEWAWPASPEEDARIVAAMRSGSQAVLTGVSGRGTQTQDTFSLLGFTASVEEARTRCAS